MNQLKIYIKTSALGKTGIHWRSIESEEYQPVEVPSLIKRQVIKENGTISIVNDLLDEVKPSLIIFRDNQENKLLLEVTGIESPQRSSKLGRKVLNSIVWIGDDKENNENILRKIAYNVIQNILQKDFLLSQMVEKSIDFYQTEGFRANLEEINNYVENLEPIQNQKSANNNLYQIKNQSPECLEELAEELRDYCLPKQWVSWDSEQKNDGVLVVVTENLEKRDILHKAGVWRGFASRVEEPVRENAQLLEKKKEPIPSVGSPKVEKLPTSPQSRQKISLMIIVGVIIIFLIVLCMTLLLQINPQPQPEQTPQPQAKQTLEPQPQATQTPESQPQPEQTPQPQAKQTLEPQPQPTQTPTCQPQPQPEQTPQPQAKQTLEPQPQATQMPSCQPQLIKTPQIRLNQSNL